MELFFLDKRPYETPEVKVVNMTAEISILYVSNYDGAPID